MLEGEGRQRVVVKEGSDHLKLLQMVEDRKYVGLESLRIERGIGI